MGTVADHALATDQGGIVDDDLAYVTPWGCDPRQIRTPLLFVHGAQDRLVPSSHATWLAQRCRTAELCLRPDDGPSPRPALPAGTSSGKASNHQPG
jgi:pimeloyl-ACP methyl ester carboxylesterase